MLYDYEIKEWLMTSTVSQYAVPPYVSIPDADITAAIGASFNKDNHKFSITFSPNFSASDIAGNVEQSLLNPTSGSSWAKLGITHNKVHMSSTGYGYNLNLSESFVNGNKYTINIYSDVIELCDKNNTVIATTNGVRYFSLLMTGLLNKYTSKFAGKFHELKLSNIASGTVYCDFVPVVDNDTNNIYIYDVINDKEYANVSGSGYFIVNTDPPKEVSSVKFSDDIYAIRDAKLATKVDGINNRIKPLIKIPTVPTSDGQYALSVTNGVYSWVLLE